MTENLKNGVPVHLFNPSGFVAQKSGPETNLWTTPAGGDEKQVFAVTLRRRHHDVKNGVTACSASKADPGCSSFVPLCVPEGQFVSSGLADDGVVCGTGRNPTVRADLIRGARSIS